ncbi:rod shape-determining protein MreC [Desulfurispira natronophila]|uniref:Cell shape-determining protein MreC n=1 Tax=Desulfurispira natronophila TaxID=682562 RepID=A0A7W8DGJ9_9BACT|nr:rod shape-determining protein MreC [Desulfurispira natronophila]MBB5021449.1 rod shape-determining protein MreC [Desulfurispira natronophila]
MKFIFAKKKRLYFFFISLFLIGIIALQVSGALHPANPINVLLMPITGSVQSALTSAQRSASEAIDRYVLLREVEENNRLLRQELKESQVALMRYHEMQRELRELRSFFHYAQESEDEYIYARVVGRSPSSWQRTITIDVGREKGIRVNMPVINQHGIVGRIVETSLGYSQILTVLDPKFAVSAVTSEHREPLVAIGGYGDTMNIRYLVASGKGNEGDLVFTSGIDQVFPSGMPVGRISDIRPDTDLFVKGEIKPFVDVNRLEEVLVLIENPVKLDEAALPEETP